MALITVAHKVSKIIQKNNRTAVKEEIAYQVKHEDISKMSVKKYAGPEFKVKTGKDFVPWTERVLVDHDQAVNRLNNVINSMVSQGMHAEDIANHFYPGNAESMRADNVPKIIRDAIVKAKRTARTEAAAREDAIVEQTFKATDVKYFDWVTEPGACKKCSAIALGGPYKVGDPDSPRIPESSHPNCRCRRIKAEIINLLIQSKLTMDLQHFAKPRNYDDVQRMFKDGVIDEKTFNKRKAKFDKVFSEGVKTPLEKIIDGRDSYYHVIGRHSDQLFNDKGVERILDTLKNPKAVYETKDFRGNKAITYIEKDNEGKTLIVVTRNGKMTTAYEPEDYYLNNIKNGRKLY